LSCYKHSFLRCDASCRRLPPIASNVSGNDPSCRNFCLSSAADGLPRGLQALVAELERHTATDFPPGRPCGAFPDRYPRVGALPPAFSAITCTIFPSEKSVSVQNAGRTRPMGETRVDLRHLLEDLRDAYPGSLEETILSEIIANSLDSGAHSVRFLIDPVSATLTIADDGSGMQRRELARYHDIAASTKTRGEGIGFAGVGIKLGLLLAREVVTETRRAKSQFATRWHFSSRHKAPWRWIPSPARGVDHGTAVSLALEDAL